MAEDGPVIGEVWIGGRVPEVDSGWSAKMFSLDGWDPLGSLGRAKVGVIDFGGVVMSVMFTIASVIP